MDFRESFYYVVKLFTNSRVYKTAISFIFTAWATVLWIMKTDEKTLIILLLMVWMFSMIFGTINWSIKNWFNIKKFLMWWWRFLTYMTLLYIVKSLEIWMHVGFLMEVAFSFMIFEMLLSIIKHAWEIWLPVPSWLYKFVKKQEQEFQDKFIWTKTWDVIDKQ